MNTTQDLLGDLDMDMDLDDLDMSPEFVDMSAGSYVLRVAGMTSKEVELEDDDEDTIQSTRLSIVFQIVQIQAAEMPAPEVGGIFSIGGIVAFQTARDQVIRTAKKAVKLADPEFFSQGRSLGDLFQRMIELYDEDNLLLCNITLRNEKYAQIRTMRLLDPASLEDFSWDEFQKATFEMSF